MSIRANLYPTLMAMLLLGAAACASESDDAIDMTSGALTAEQCEFFFDPGAKTTICHHTSSEKNPYVIIKTDYNGCLSGHSDHAEDYVTSNDPNDPTYDPTCAGKGCYPEGAPFDGSAACCEGLEPNDEGDCAKPSYKCDFSSVYERLAEYEKYMSQWFLPKVWDAFRAQDCSLIADFNMNEVAKMLSEGRMFLTYSVIYLADSRYVECSNDASAQGLFYDGKDYQKVRAELDDEMKDVEGLEYWLVTSCGY